MTPSGHRGRTGRPPAPGADTDPDEPAVHRKERLAACTYPR